MNRFRLTKTDIVYLNRILRMFAKSTWGASYYRAQIHVLKEVERLRRENRCLRGMVPPALLRERAQKRAGVMHAAESSQ